MKIQLLTRDHGFVRDGEIPPFRPAPEVITWGSRVFVHDETANVEDPEVEVYIEGLAYPLEVADKPFSDVLPKP